MPKKILYFLTPGNHVSPFDITIAVDAGFDLVVPFTGIQPENVRAIVQDAIFCRPPKRFNDTCIFIGGRDVHLATDMFQAAKKSMVDDFAVGVFADPNGAYTTSASIVALVEQVLKEQYGVGISGRNVSVFGVGPVGLCSAILATQKGAKTRLCQLTAEDNERVALRFCERYMAPVEWVSAQTDEEKITVLKDTEIVICAAHAGIRILSTNKLKSAQNLLVAADTNAVPPSGVAGIDLHGLGVPVQCGDVKFLGIGPLAIGNLKYKVQFGLFQKTHQHFKPAFMDFPDAYDFATFLLEDQRKRRKVA